MRILLNTAGEVQGFPVFLIVANGGKFTYIHLINQCQLYFIIYVYTCVSKLSGIANTLFSASASQTVNYKPKVFISFEAQNVKLIFKNASENNQR